MGSDLFFLLKTMYGHLITTVDFSASTSDGSALALNLARNGKKITHVNCILKHF